MQYLMRQEIVQRKELENLGKRINQTKSNIKIDEGKLSEAYNTSVRAENRANAFDRSAKPIMEGDLTPEEFISAQREIDAGKAPGMTATELAMSRREALMRPPTQREIDQMRASMPKGTSEDDAVEEVMRKRLSGHKTEINRSLKAEDKAWLRASQIKFGVSTTLAAGSAYGYFNTLGDMFRNGANTKGIFTAIGTAGALAGGLHGMHTALTEHAGKFGEQLTGFMSHIIGDKAAGGLTNALESLSSGWGILGTIGVMTFLGWFMNRQKSAEELAAERLNEEVDPYIWHDGPVLSITAGMALMTMGINLSPTAPLMQEISVPQVTFTQALAKAGVTAPQGAERYRTVFVQQGDASQPSRVMYVTYEGLDKQGRPKERVHVTTLDKGLKFTNPGNGRAYIPFFVRDSKGETKENQVAMKALVEQKRLLDATKALNAQEGQAAAKGAGGTNKPNQPQ
jgi:hypothetical protein